LKAAPITPAFSEHQVRRAASLFLSRSIKAAESRLRLKYEFPTLQLTHVYEVRPRKDHRGVDLISDALPFVRLW